MTNTITLVDHCRRPSRGAISPRLGRRYDSVTALASHIMHRYGVSYGVSGSSGDVSKAAEEVISCLEEWSRHSDLNRGPAVYETAALPLSYVGPVSHAPRERMTRLQPDRGLTYTALSADDWEVAPPIIPAGDHDADHTDRHRPSYRSG